MEYKVNTEALAEKVRQEIARAASREYSDDGTPLYDSIWPTSQDDAIVKGLMDDAVSNVLTKFRLASPVPDGDVLVFNLPDLDESLESSARDALERYIVLEVCRRWTSKVSENLSAKYAEEAGNALDNAVKILYSRKILRR